MDHLNRVVAWLNEHWTTLVVGVVLVMTVLRSLVALLRICFKPADGTRLDGFCDVVEGLVGRYEVILDGLDKIRKGRVVEGIETIIETLPDAVDSQAPTPVPGNEQPGDRKV